MEERVTHYAPKRDWRDTVCKIHAFIVYYSFNKQEVTCKNCRRTKAFRGKP